MHPPPPPPAGIARSSRSGTIFERQLSRCRLPQFVSNVATVLQGIATCSLYSVNGGVPHDSVAGLKGRSVQLSSHASPSCLFSICLSSDFLPTKTDLVVYAFAGIAQARHLKGDFYTPVASQF